MTEFDVIADDVTGACDVGAELAVAGFSVRVALEVGAAAATDGECVRVVNTQSRAVRASEAYARVLRIARRQPMDLLLKKIDTALRGHLGAELDAAVDGLGAAAAFVVPAIPAAGRVTRNGCQWFGGRRLSDTEFASDPEGCGGEASVPAVIARESRRRTEVIGLDALRAGALPERARALMRAGTDLFVVDAETDDDLALAVGGILDLPRPLCVAGSIGVAAALAAHLAPTSRPAATVARAAFVAPALIVCGSLHSTARAQLDALCLAGIAERIALPERVADATTSSARAALVARARACLGAGRSVILAPAPAAHSPDVESRRAVERALALLARDTLRTRSTQALVLIGGETSHAILREIGATELVVHGRVVPLVAAATVVGGEAHGFGLVVKGGSGGDPATLRSLLVADGPAHHAAAG